MFLIFPIHSSPPLVVVVIVIIVAILTLTNVMIVIVMVMMVVVIIVIVIIVILTMGGCGLVGTSAVSGTAVDQRFETTPIKIRGGCNRT